MGGERGIFFFFFSQDYILRCVFLWVGCGCCDKQKLFLFVTAPAPGPRRNPAKCVFHTAILGSTFQQPSHIWGLSGRSNRRKQS